MRLLNLVTVATVFMGIHVFAHPGHDTRHEIAEREKTMKHNKRDLSHCAAKMEAQGLDRRASQRRSTLAKSLREKRKLPIEAPYLRARDISTALNTSHHSPVNYSPLSPETTIFIGNSSCILTPEVTQGPYYTSGEYVRRNLIDDQKGIELVLDLQVIDVETCEPVVNAFLDIWSCNSTGVYSGVVSQGNGNSNDIANLNNTFLRGLQPTQYDGVAQFTTLFPGHYTGRATHIHIIAHLDGSVLSNSTLNSTTSAHVGQIFFDQDLISQVETFSPYSQNEQTITSNSEDSIFSTEAATTDPVVQYSPLGDTVEDGIFAWVAFGINTTASTTITPTAIYSADGGRSNPNYNISSLLAGLPAGFNLSSLFG